MFKNKLSILLIVIVFSCLLSGCRTNNDHISKEGFYFDTIISITLYDSDYEYAIDHCLDMAKYYEDLFSDTIETSDIYRINHSKEPVTVNEETIELIKKGIEFSKLSNNKFDITIGLVCDEWDIWLDPDKESLREKTSIEETSKKCTDLISSVSVDNIILEDDKVSIKDGCAIDLGGIAKGYIADKMKEYLLSEGITNGFINLGGNVLVLKGKDNNPITVGIQKPFDENATAALTVNVTDKSVVTSGIYQRYYESVEGSFIHHIIDSTTGLPCNNNINSVTIITNSSTDADALSTICYLLGENEGMSLIESLEDTEAIYILKDNTIALSSGMGDEIPYKIIEKKTD